MIKQWYTSSSGRIEFWLYLNDAHIGYHPGQCDADIAQLRLMPYIVEQLSKVDPALLREELSEWGAWDDDELSDHDQNLTRILWIACGDIVDHED